MPIPLDDLGDQGARFERIGTQEGTDLSTSAIILLNTDTPVDGKYLANKAERSYKGTDL